MSDSPQETEVDWFIFVAGSLLLVAVIIPIVFAPDASRELIANVFTFLTTEMGIVYIIAATLIFVFLLVVAVSGWGRIRLGDQPPQYSSASWIAMLFSCGIGASLIYWGAAEWVFYYLDPPFGIEAKSDEAVLWAMSYGMFHWGPVGWALYCLPAIALACSYHIKKIPSLRLSDACEPVLGSYTHRIPGRIIDLLFIIGLLGTAATGLGLGTSVVASAATRMTGLEDGFEMQAIIIFIVTITIAFSVYRGMDGGIRLLSNINMSLALILVTFVLLVGPTRFILEMAIVSIGHITSNFVRMMTWADPLQRSSFVESWTVFYWAWWLALGPFVGMFVCKISHGRTIREVIFGMMGWGSLGCWLFFIVLGNHAFFLEQQGILPIVQEASEVSPSAAIASIIAILPFGTFWLFYLAVIGIIFTATTYDSASYTLAAGASRYLGEHDHPARWHRVFWAAALGILPASLLYLGGIRVLQTASVVASLPLLLVYLMLAVSIVRTLSSAVPTKD